MKKKKKRREKKNRIVFPSANSPFNNIESGTIRDANEMSTTGRRQSAVSEGIEGKEKENGRELIERREMKKGGPTLV